MLWVLVLTWHSGHPWESGSSPAHTTWAEVLCNLRSGANHSLCFIDRSCLDCIGKNAIILKSQISLLPPKLLQQVLKKITFWTAANYRKEQRIRKEETENNQPRVSSCWALQVQCGCVLASDHTSHPPLQWRLDLRTQWETHVWLMWLHGTGDMEIRCS